MAAPAFFAPAFSVIVGGKQLEANVTMNILDLRFTDAPGQIDTFSFTLANPYPELRWTHDRALKDLFAEGVPVEIHMGYVDDLHLMIDGLITSTSPTFPSSGTPTVGIQGKSWMHKLTLQRRQRTFPKLTDKEIVEQIARSADYHFEVAVDETGIKRDSICQNNESDFVFLGRLAQRVGCELVVEGKKLKFLRPTYPKLYTLAWGHPSRDYDPKNFMPLLELNPTLNTKDQVSEVIVRGQHPETRELFEGRAGKGDEGRKMGKGKTGAELTEGAIGKGSTFILVNQPLRSKQEADQLAKTIYQKKALEFVTGSGSTIGLPRLRSGQLIEVEGLGYRFSGEYCITETTHSIGGSGYQTSFNVQRNAINE